MPNFVRPLLSASLILAFASCSDVTAPKTVSEAQSLWRSKNITSYSYVISVGCFCLLPPPATVEVFAGQVSRVTVVATGAQLPITGYFTIDEQFDHILTATTPPTVEFDRALGYPTKIEHCCMADDSGSITTISSLVRLDVVTIQ
jgi:hypothetical protein